MPLRNSDHDVQMDSEGMDAEIKLGHEESKRQGEAETLQEGVF